MVEITLKTFRTLLLYVFHYKILLVDISSESSNIFENDLNKIKMQRLEHFSTLIVGYLNINSIKNKFEMIAETIINVAIF